MLKLYLIAAILVGSAYGITVPFTQSYPTTSDSGLKIETVHMNPCTALPCKMAEGSTLEFDMEFKGQADYDLTDSYGVAFSRIGGHNVETVVEICDKLSIINGDDDGNPCTINAGGQYKIQTVNTVPRNFEDGAYEAKTTIEANLKPVATFTYSFDLVN